MHILFVCLGNICRSPLAEGILKKKIGDYGLDWHVESAGTGSWHIGETPDPRSVEIAHQYGIDITDQEARQFSPYDFERFNRIYVMDGGNYADVIQYAQTEEEQQKVHYLLDILYSGQQLEVPDPYWDDNGFQKVYQLLDKTIEELIEQENSSTY
jgi:protein-tyrosine phosphatase